MSSSVHAQAPPGGAQDLTESAFPDLVSWWAEPGRPGMTDMAWLHSGFAPRWAGFMIGGWVREESDRVPQASAEPWMLGAGPTLAAHDSVEFELGGSAARDGFASGLARARSRTVDRTGEQKTRSVIHSGGGVFAYGSSAIAIERGDSSGFVRTEIVDVRHGSTGSLDRSGYHSYEVIGQWDLAGTRASGGFSHRGTAGSLAGGEEQAGKAESGFARIMRTFGRARVEAGYERGYDGRESFGGFREFSRRDAESTLGYLGASMPVGRAWMEARLSGGQTGVERSGEGAEANDASWGWGSVALAMPLGPGSAHVAAGVGRHGAFDHFEPSLSVFYETGETLKLRAGAERLVRPIWTDLGIGEDPFIQSTWAGVLSVTRLGAATRLHGYVTGGHCRDRALAANEPFEDLWLRDGLFRDPETYTFFLTGVEGQWRSGPWTLAGEGFAIGTNGQSEQPRYDPDTGGRAEVVYRTTAFKGDLGIMMRAGVEYVGSRESLFFVKRTLPGYATSQVGAALSLVDATVTLLVRNLEDQYHELPWINTLTFSEALTTGREWRLFFTLRLSS